MTKRFNARDALSAGYDAFGPALEQQINTYLNTNGLNVPTQQQISAIVKGVADAVRTQSAPS